MREEQKTSRLRDALREAVAYETGTVLRGYSITYKDNLTRLTIRAFSPNGRKVVAFITSGDEHGCFAYLYDCLYTKGAKLKWKEDHYT